MDSDLPEPTDASGSGEARDGARGGGTSLAREEEGSVPPVFAYASEQSLSLCAELIRRASARDEVVGGACE